MNRRTFARLALAAATVAATPLAAQDAAIDRWLADPEQVFDAADVMLGDLRYRARALIVFADSPEQAPFREQLRLIAAGAAELARRDVIVLTDTTGGSDARAILRPRGFSLVLVDKDGTVVFRKPDPWTVREISRQIDKLPSRIQEIRDGLG